MWKLPGDEKGGREHLLPRSNAVRNKIFEDVREERLQAEPRCIKQYPGFEAVCLNVWVLQTAWLQYKQQ